MAVYRLWTGDQGLGVRGQREKGKEKWNSNQICRFMKMSFFQMKSLVKHAD